jgi:uncharacterized membrane protein YkoI
MNPMKKTHESGAMAALALMAGLTTGPVWAGEDVPSPLATEAKISQESAAKTALARIPGGSIQSSELEKEHGKLVWEFEILDPTSKKITEVQVDANSGEFVAEETDSSPD